MSTLTGSILIADDTRTVRRILRLALEKSGHTVTEAKDGLEALEQLRDQSFDLIFLDVEMPRMNGFEVLKKLKSHDISFNIPVIVISANDELESAVRCIELGAVDYLTKPFNATLLRARVQSCLEKKRLHDREVSRQKEIENLYHQLKKADEAKDEFVAMVAHELRNPINGLMAGHQILERLNDEASPQKKVLSSMFFALDSLQLLVADLNDVSQIENGNISLSFGKIDIEHIIDRVISSLQHKIDVNQHTLEIDIAESLGEVWGDQFRITQILTNLVSNAVKYTPKEGQITMKARPFTSHPAFLHITVEDSGVGMSQTAVEKIFDKYYRVMNDKTAHIEGIGLGMFITKTLIEKHHGDIWIKSQPGKGTAVHFTLPFASHSEWANPLKDDTFSPNFVIS